MRWLVCHHGVLKGKACFNMEVYILFITSTLYIFVWNNFPFLHKEAASNSYLILCEGRPVVVS